uniref:Uncharacterized protein n=1 Tax=Mycena chlorophos TaxID=658473 RepID=A0ABQ0M7G9_MYCCL|nr:predicted protein [Mycena chlorophos]
MATDLITWLRSKTFVLALLRKVQQETNSPLLAIIRAVLTRWTSHYLAFTRLLEISGPLKLLVSQEDLRGPDNQIITGDSKAKARARAMVRTIKNDTFWAAIQRMKTHLQPLALAANITQAAFCRLDEVLFTFGHLYREFDRLNQRADRHIREAVLASIERRWAKCDQDVFIVTAILNPFVDLRAFKQVSIL